MFTALRYKVSAAEQELEKMPEYNYRRFHAHHYALDRFPGPKPGQAAVDFTARTARGDVVRLSDYFGSTIVLETGSFTCPQYVGWIARMNELAARFPDVTFLVLYVREAHPGPKVTAHRSCAEKRQLASRLPGVDEERRTILVDDLDGTAHRVYGSLPNMIYIFDAAGIVAYRSDWNRPTAVAKALTALARGVSAAGVGGGFRPIGPRAIVRVLPRGGWSAVRDFIVAFPGLALQHLKGLVTRA